MRISSGSTFGLRVTAKGGKCVSIAAFAGNAKISRTKFHRDPATPKTENQRMLNLVSSDQILAMSAPHLRRAACSVFLISIAMVIGPTPPGTGVIAPATAAT